VLLTLLFSLCFASIGNGLWRTFNLALMGDAPALPLTTADALSQGWVLSNAQCDNTLGYLYTQNSATPQKSTPLSIYYTAGGQVSGLAVNIFGSGAAPDSLVDQGFWIPVANTKDEWTLSVSFRAPGASIMCNTSYTSSDILGDRIVINPSTISYSLPLTAADAYCENWTSGSCMTTMGEHWFYDLSTAPFQSWESQNLLPVVTMFYPPDMTGTISTIFFTTPVAQPGADYVLYKPGDWETPALSPSEMCENYCNSTCTWPGVSKWSTMHIYLNSQWSTITCPNGKGFVGRECPDLDYGSVSC